MAKTYAPLVKGASATKSLVGDLVLAAPVFDPATLSLSVWNRANYAGAPWSGTASAGASGTRSLVHVTSDPAVGTAVNGYNPASMAGGTSQLADNTSLLDALITAGAYSVILLFKANSAAAPTGTPYADKCFLSDTGGGAYFSLSFSTSGIQIQHLDGAYTGPQVACGTGAYHAAFAKYDGVNLKLKVDSGAYTSMAKGNITAGFGTGNHLRFNDQYTGPGTGGVDCSVLELMISTTTLSDASMDNVKSYFNTRYGLSL